MNFLAPIGFLYGRIIDLRNYLYDRGTFKSFDLGARTISVGNLTTGGTGKTPLVALIAEILFENGEKVCILTRGYGRKNENERVVVCGRDSLVADSEIAGDEPVELAQKLLGKAIIIADADRIAAAKWARDKFEITTFILDDGFQHRRAKRDLDIVCIDATDPFGNGKILPAGRLRESLSGLRRADAIVITRTNQVENLADAERLLQDENATAPIFNSTSQIAEFVPLEEFQAKTQSSQSELPKSVYAFCGVGNPESFFLSLEKKGVKVTGKKALKDHVLYDQEKIRLIEDEAKANGAGSLVTTAKDAVKLIGLDFTLQCYVAMAETVVEYRAKFRKLITSS